MTEMVIETSLALDIEYAVVENPSKERAYPVDVLKVRLRGKDIHSLLHIGQIMTLQRQVFNRLVDEGELTLPANKYGMREEVNNGI